MDVTGRFVSAFADLNQGALVGPELVPVRLAIAVVSVLPIGGAGISLFTASGIRVPVGASDSHSSDAERLQFTTAEGPCLEAHHTERPVIASESTIAENWPTFHRELVTRTPFRAITSVPLHWGLAEFATIDLYFHRSEDLDLVDMSTVNNLVDEMSMIIIDDVSVTPGLLPKWLDSPAAELRSWIFLAIGMLNVDMELSTQDALAVLRAHAHSTDRSIDDIAHDLVDQIMPLSDLRFHGDA